MKRAILKRTLPIEKFEELMRLIYIDDITHSLNDDDDSENAMHEEGLNEMLKSFFWDGNNDDDNDHMVDVNDGSRGDYHKCNIDYNNLKYSINKVAKTPVFRSGVEEP